MYKTEFIPNIGAGQIKLDSARDEIRKTLGAFKEFKKTKFSKNTTDDFSFCHIYYNEQNKVDAIEFFDSTEFLFKETNLFQLSFKKLKSFLKTNSFDFIEDDTGIRSDIIGLSVYSPDKEKIETILVYKKGYYS